MSHQDRPLSYKFTLMTKYKSAQHDFWSRTYQLSPAMNNYTTLSVTFTILVMKISFDLKQSSFYDQTSSPLF